MWSSSQTYPVDIDTDPHNRGAALTHTRRRPVGAVAHGIRHLSRAVRLHGRPPVGVLVVKSREWLYAEALETLRRNLSFHRALGFNSVGRPRSLHLETGLVSEGSDMSAAAVASKLNKTQSCSALTRGDSWGRNTKVDQCACHAPASSTCQNPSVRTAPPRSAQAGAHPLRNGASGRASQ